jgi:hypothetical protein
MHKHRYSYLIPIITGAFLLLASLIILWPATQASAQCGSQASSCKNCHETQGQDPVNNDGKDWHSAHAFGDFCYACHGGNNQSMDKATAHTGMVDPMSDIKVACGSCHPNDLQARAEVYAKELGTNLNQAGSATQAPGSTPAATPVTGAGSTTGGGSTSSGAPAAPAGMVVDNSNVIDYNQRYAETVEGVLNINWGNVILVVLIVLLALGGGAFIYTNERKLRGLPRLPTMQKPVKPETALPQVEGYSPEVVALLPMIARLNPKGLHALKRLLDHPDQANDLLHALAQLDPELVRRIRLLDRDSRELLLALAGD